MAMKSSIKKEGWAAWLLTKLFDELTGNYYRNAAAETQVKRPFAAEGSRIPEETELSGEALGRANGASPE
jgi:hypothetical protein